MPIEIKELYIKVAVSAPGAGPATPAPSPGGAAQDRNDPNAVIAECVEQVLQILQQKAER